jgi:hypothetical protein
MTTSLSARRFDITPGQKISRGTLAYVRTRVRQWAYNLIVDEFKKSGITQAELSRRLDKTPDVISRLLSRPSNIEMDTFSCVVFAISGGSLPSFSLRGPSALNAVREVVTGPSRREPGTTLESLSAVEASKTANGNSNYSGLAAA